MIIKFKVMTSRYFALIIDGQQSGWVIKEWRRPTDPGVKGHYGYSVLIDGKEFYATSLRTLRERILRKLTNK